MNDLLRFRNGWSIISGGVAEYGRIKYVHIGPYHIGIGIRWCETLGGQIMPSNFSHSSSGGSHRVRHCRVLWYVHFTACRTGWYKFPFFYFVD